MDLLDNKKTQNYFSEIFMRETSLRVITTKSKRWRKVNNVPRVRVNFVNAEEIVAKNRPFVKKLQSVTTQFKESVFANILSQLEISKHTFHFLF